MATWVEIEEENDLLVKATNVFLRKSSYTRTFLWRLVIKDSFSFIPLIWILVLLN